MKFTRTWAMPNHNTFSIKPIADFVGRYLLGSHTSVDPFARDFKGPTHTNDLNQNTSATHHMEAIAFLDWLGLASPGSCDLALLDPPYSPRQISECYQQIGRKVTTKDTQSAAMKKHVRDALMPCLSQNAVVLSFGWNSVGMGINRGFELIEILMVCHGGDHNDTICIAERRTPPRD